MMKMFGLYSFLILLVTTVTYSYHFQCPIKSQRPLRASAYCSSSLISKYMCLYDTNKLLFSEQCNQNPDYATRGEKYVLSGSLRNVDCSPERYQPFPLWSNVSGECLYQKTSCEEEGQVIHRTGSFISDISCLCDSKRGYTFVEQPKHKCFCIPSEEDCSCYINKCPDGYKLTSDYECVKEKHPYDSKCPTSENKSGSRQSPFIKSTKDIVRIVVEHDTKTLVIGTKIILVLAILGSVYLSYIVCTHHFVEPAKVYNENYELQVYKLLQAASRCDLQMLKRIKNLNYININETDHNKRSALHLAACEGHVDTVKYLLKNNGVYLKGKDRCLGQTASEDAHWYMKRNDNNIPGPHLNKITALLEKQKRLQKDRYYFKESVAMKMIRAVELGNDIELKRMHGMQTDMNLSDHNGRTALHVAVDFNKEHVIDFLIKCKVSPFVRWSGKRPVDLQARHNSDTKTSENIENKLREYMNGELEHQTGEHKIEDKPKDDGGDKDSHIEEADKTEHDYNYDELVDLKIVRILNSALRGDIRLMKQYKADGYCMTVSDYDKRTALHIAVNNNQEHIVEYLLKECNLTDEADTAEDRWRKTPFQAAMKEGKEHILKIFLDYCPNLPNPTNAEERNLFILMACVHGDLKRLKRYKAAEYCMTVSDDYKGTAMHIAMNNNQEHIVEYLLKECNLTEEAGTAQDRSGITPFKAAMVGGRDHILQMFLKYCPDLPNPTTDEERRDAILMASKNGDVQRLKKYNKKGYNMKVSDSCRETALHKAVKNKQARIVEYLLKECNLTDEADTAEDIWGVTPFEAAKMEECEQILNIFTKYCPNFANTSEDERTTFTLLLVGDDNGFNKLKRLYKVGGSLHMLNSYGNTVWKVSADTCKWNINAMEYLKDTDKKQKGVLITCKKEDQNLYQTNS